MKIRLLVAFLLANCFAIDSRATTNRPPVLTNVLSFHLVAGQVSDGSLRDGSAEPYALNLIPTPILSDADFVSWDVKDQSFIITPAAAIRVAVSCSDYNVPFVLMSNGEPIYLGVFRTGFSSAWIAVPQIYTDLILSQCFVSLTNVPLDVLRMLQQSDPSVMGRLMALTNATTNVTLQIERGYPPADGSDRNVDRRRNSRIAIAVEKLFGNRKH